MTPTLIIQASVFSRSGYGEHARDIVMALWNSKKFNIALAPTGWGSTSTTDNIPLEQMDVLMYCLQNQVPQDQPFTFVHLGIPPEFKKVGAKNIGITAGLESDKLPRGWAEACNQMDAIIVPTEFMQKLFVSGGVSVPVHVVGEGVDTAVYNPNVQCTLPLSFSTPFNLLGGGQWMMNAIGEDRKGLGLLLKIFCDTFAEMPEVGLVLKTMSMNISSPDNVITQKRIEQIKAGKPFPKIHLIHGDMSESEMAQLYRHPQIKGFISTTSGEGWHRMLAEAISSDLPVMVTGWSGHMDFVNKNLDTTFEYKLGPVPQSVMSPGMFEPGMNWAYPDIPDIQHKLRRFYNGYSVALERAKKHGEEFRMNWNKERTSQKLVEVFEQIVPSGGSIITSPHVQMEKV